jgi:adenylate cyclase
MKTLTKRRLQVLWRVSIISAIGGAIFGFANGGAEAIDAMQGAATGAFIGTTLGLFEIVFVNGPPGVALRRLPFALSLALRTLAALLVFVVGLRSGSALFKGQNPFAADPDFLSGLAFSTAFALAVLFVVQVDGLLGQGELWKFIRGRYHRPREEDRIFLFLDLAGSTAIAERIGGIRFLELLNRLYEDLAETIAEYGGEIHKYVGDEVIVTWTPETGLVEARAIACALAIERTLAGRAESYAQAFGTAPRFRAGLHLGRVVSGELGSSKREIAYLGDAVNIAARLVDSCRALGRSCIASASLVERTSLPPGIRVEPLGEIALRGRVEPIQLFAVSAR